MEVSGHMAHAGQDDDEGRSEHVANWLGRLENAVLREVTSVETASENVPLSTLGEACQRWQSGRDGGSSLIRGAARVLTGVPHYFQAVFITAYEDKARADPAALACARLLLDQLGPMAECHDPEAWARELGVPGAVFCGRGLVANPEGDTQIEDKLNCGSIDMPLWGVSLSKSIAEGYGTRFLLQIDGPFPAIPAWQHSGIKSEQLELITGGHYTVVDVERSSTERTTAHLRWERPLAPKSHNWKLDAGPLMSAQYWPASRRRQLQSDRYGARHRVRGQSIGEGWILTRSVPVDVTRLPSALPSIGQDAVIGECS